MDLDIGRTDCNTALPIFVYGLGAAGRKALREAGSLESAGVKKFYPAKAQGDYVPVTFAHAAIVMMVADSSVADVREAIRQLHRAAFAATQPILLFDLSQGASGYVPPPDVCLLTIRHDHIPSEEYPGGTEASLLFHALQGLGDIIVRPHAFSLELSGLMWVLAGRTRARLHIVTYHEQMTSGEAVVGQLRKTLSSPRRPKEFIFSLAHGRRRPSRSMRGRILDVPSLIRNLRKFGLMRWGFTRDKDLGPFVRVTVIAV